MFEKIPIELKMEGLFCAWKLTERGKVPLNIKTNEFGKSNDKDTFVDFNQAYQNIQKYMRINSKGQLTGGLGLGIFNNFSAIDIDGCVEDGKPNKFAIEIINYFNSYTEYSPSGKGIRIIYKNDNKFKYDKNKYYINNQKIGLEVYVEGVTNKYVTLTGNAIIDEPIKKVNIQNLMDKYMLKKQTTTKPIKSTTNIDKFLNKDKELYTLWNNTAPGSGSNENELDLALANKLTFYLGHDFDKVNDAFMSSPYYQSKDDKHKDKWETRDDYRDMTISKAFDGTPKVYDPNYYVKQNPGGVENMFFSYNDTSNARYFIEMYGEKVRYNVTNKIWMTWNGKYWQPDYFNQVKLLAERMVAVLKKDTDKILSDKGYRDNINKMLNKSGKENMLKEAEHLEDIPISNDSLDANKYYFNCKSGVLDLETSKLYPHSPVLMQSKYSDVSLEYSNEPKLFMKFLNDIFEKDVVLIDYVLKIFALSLTGDTSEQKVWFFVGDGANGKGVLSNIMQFIMGEYASVASSELIIDKKFQSDAKSEVAKLKGVRAVFISELPMKGALSEANVKNMTGEDKITARFLYANEFEFIPDFKIFVQTNHEPIIRGTDKGIWRRVKIIRFNRYFAPHEVDRDLLNKLKKEKDQIFTLLVKYYKKYKTEGLVEPLAVKNATNEYRKDMDLVEKFIDEECMLGAQMEVKASEVWNRFRIWLSNRDEFRMSQTLFGRSMAKKFEKAKRNGGYTYYLGLKLRDYND